ncbi:MAG: PEGA domain-containing protein [bacterium]|nr:PEGA domain-containing protein [bacterium]
MPVESWGEPAPETRSWSDKLQAGSLAYENLEFAEASRILKEVISVLEEGREGRDTIKILARADLYLGMVYLAEGLESLAEKQFDSASLLDPGLVLDPQLFPPEIIAGFSRAKSRIESRGRISLKVETRPAGAEIFFDGRPVGKGPLSLSVIPGTHYLSAENAEGPFPGRKLELKAREEARVLLELGKVPAVSVAPAIGSGAKSPRSPWWKKKAVIIGGSALVLGTVTAVVLICVLKGKGGSGETGAVFVRW